MILSSKTDSFEIVPNLIFFKKYQLCYCLYKGPYRDHPREYQFGNSETTTYYVIIYSRLFFFFLIRTGGIQDDNDDDDIGLKGQLKMNTKMKIREEEKIEVNNNNNN